MFVQKWNDKLCPKVEDYPIFFAVSEKSGKDNSGEYVYRKDKDGNLMFDSQGKKILEHDLDEIAEEFRKFREEKKINY